MEATPMNTTSRISKLNGSRPVDIRGSWHLPVPDSLPVGDAGPRWEGGEVPRSHPVQVTIHPGIYLAREDVDELLLVPVRVRPRGAMTRWQALQVDPQPL
jgi:hypothetical protein